SIGYPLRPPSFSRSPQRLGGGGPPTGPRRGGAERRIVDRGIVDRGIEVPRVDVQEGRPGRVVDQRHAYGVGLVAQPGNGEDRGRPPALVARGVAHQAQIALRPVLAHVRAQQDTDTSVRRALLRLLDAGEQRYAGPAGERVRQARPQPAQRQQPHPVELGGERDERRGRGQQGRRARERGGGEQIGRASWRERGGIPGGGG